MHAEYPANAYILPVVCPSIFNEDFYLRAFDRGFDGIIVMYSGSDCPYKGGADRTAMLVNRAYAQMKARNMDVRRLRLVAICTVCTTPFLNEVRRMNAVLREIGPLPHPLPAATTPVAAPAGGTRQEAVQP